MGWWIEGRNRHRMAMMPACTHARKRMRQSHTDDADSHMSPLLGTPIYLSEDTPLYPNIFTERLQPYDQSKLNELRQEPDTQHVDSGDPADNMVVIVPAAIALITLIRNTPRKGHSYTYIQHNHVNHPHDTPSLHRASMVFTSLNMPADCTVHGILYQDNSSVLVLGLFDMSSLDNSELHEEAPLVRHMRMRQVLDEQNLSMGSSKLLVRHLWVGQEKACLRWMLQKPQSIPNMSFTVKCIGVMPMHIRKNKFERKLLPLSTPYTLPRTAGRAAEKNPVDLDGFILGSNNILNSPQETQL